VLLAMAPRRVAVRKVPEYSHHKLEDLCAGTEGEKKEVKLHNKPLVLTLNSTLRFILKCHLELELHSDQFGFSVFTEEMNFERTEGCSRDFYQFGRDYLVFTSHKGKKRCGQVKAARRVLREDGSLLRIDYGRTSRAQREYVEDVDKEMDLWLAVHPSARGEPAKLLHLVITPFKKQCAGDDYYYRRCPSKAASGQQCIKRELFCDGQINCGGTEKDEQQEYCLQHLGGADMFITIPIIILIVVFSVVGLMFLVFLVKMCSTHLKPKRPGPRQVEQTMSLCPPPPAAPAREGRGLRALHAQLSSPPSAPAEEQPAPLPSLPPSYTEAVSTPSTPLYPCAPPKYTELPEGGSSLAPH